MISVSGLRPLFGDELSANINHEQIGIFYQHFVEDFITSPFTVRGKKIKINSNKPKAKEYADYCETFFHFITRTTYAYNMRLYECERANRVHWIKPILLSVPSSDVLYYRWKDEKGICKHHYWAMSKKFMIVLKDIEPDVQILTAFCVDDDEKDKYFERYKAFKEGNRC